MTAAWNDDVWKTVIARMNSHTLTPVIGAGVSAGVLGTGAELAASWAEEVPYPFDERFNLAAVAQYVAITGDRAQPGEYIAERFAARLNDIVVFDAVGQHHPYRALTSKPIRVWLTTNYDDLIARALLSRDRPPRIGTSMWAPPKSFWDKSAFDLQGFTPTDKTPLVFHLHGTYKDARSMVITEADYLEFLEQMAGTTEVLPTLVQSAIASTSLLFIGYGFRDINFHLLLRQWETSRTAYVVRPLPPGLDAEQAVAFKAYYPDYLSHVTNLKVQMFWGTAEEFCAELADAAARGLG